MIKFEELKSIEVNCSTENIPPPYSYTYSLYINLNNSNEAKMSLPIQYELKYIDREDIEDEDIIDEGFSMNDDYKWKGTLPAVWYSELKDMFKKTTWHQKELKYGKSTTASLKISLIDQDGNHHDSVPSNQESWEYFLQEMIQAIYEISNKELPLEVKFKEIDDKKNETAISIRPFFSSRTVNIKIEKEKKITENKQIPWNNLKEILKSVYFPDYDYEYALEKIPDKSGKYIDNGEGVWYEFGVGVKNPNKNINSLERLERSLKDLVIE